MNPADPVARLLASLDNVKPNGTGHTARCPGHDDRHNSLKIDTGKDGQALIHCHAGCEPERIVAALGWRLADLYPPRAGSESHRRIVATYDYRDEAGTLLYQGVRYQPKDFRQRQPDGNGGWTWNLQGVRHVPYRLPELLAADPSEWVLIVEGEKDADRLAALGFVATTNAAGAGKWRPELSEYLRGRRVCIIPDRDDAGEKHAALVARSLAGIASETRVLRLPNLPDKGDASDWLDAGGTAEELRRRRDQAPAWETLDATPEDDAPTHRPNAPTFPLDALPPVLRDYLSAAAQSLDVPAEMVAVPMLGIAGALMGNRLHLVLKHSWREYPTFYIAVVAPPGSAKTPALNLAKWPLDALQERARQDHVERLAQHEIDIEAWKAADTEERGPKPRTPRQRQFFSTDLTVEALVAMLAHEPGIAIIRDEIGGWVAAMDQYRGGKGSDRQQYLSLWSGGTIKADRKVGESAYARFPVACVVGSIQPDLAGDLHHANQKRDGFVERLIPLVPEVGVATWTEATPTREHYAAVLALFRQLDALPPGDAIEETEPAGIGVKLHPDAKRLFVAWHDENARLVASAHGLAAGFYAKLPSYVARSALVLHALWHPEDPSAMVSRDGMQNAIELGEFFRAHIQRFLVLLHSATPSRSAGLETRILRILRMSEAENDGWVSRSEVLNRLRNVTAEELTEAFNTMLKHGEVERRVVPGSTKPTEQWRLAISTTPFGYSEYSDYLGSDGSNSEYSEYPNGHAPDLPKTEYEEIVL